MNVSQNNLETLSIAYNDVDPGFSINAIETSTNRFFVWLVALNTVEDFDNIQVYYAPQWLTDYPDIPIPMICNVQGFLDDKKKQQTHSTALVDSYEVNETPSNLSAFAWPESDSLQIKSFDKFREDGFVTFACSGLRDASHLRHGWVKLHYGFSWVFEAGFTATNTQTGATISGKGKDVYHMIDSAWQLAAASLAVSAVTSVLF